MSITRRGLCAGAVAALAAGAGSPAPADDDGRDYPAPKFLPKGTKPALGATLDRDFVIFAHYDLDMVKQLLEKEPALLNAAVDWGGGDWESALGGASHMGRRDIAEFLIGKGARVDLFASAMLGHAGVVKGLLDAHPNLVDAKGPHGIPLLAHAKAGKEPAQGVVAYLEGLAAKKAP